MTWTAPPTFVSLHTLTAAQMNATLGVVSGVNGDIYSDPVGVVTTAGDMAYAGSAHEMTRLALGTKWQHLVSNGSVPGWNTIGLGEEPIYDSGNIGSTQANFNFSVVSPFNHLLIRAYLRTNSGNTEDAIYVYVNGTPGTTNYDAQLLTDRTGAFTISESFGGATVESNDAAGGGAPANLFTAVKWEIPNYQQTTNNKAILVACAMKVSAVSGGIGLHRRANFWRSNGAITSVTITPAAGSWDVGSRVVATGIF